MLNTTASVVHATEIPTTSIFRPFAEADALRVWNYWFGRRALSVSTQLVADPYADAYRLDHGLWFHAGADVDVEVTAHFGDLVERAARGELDGWQETARGSLALVLLLGRFPLLVHRGAAQAFASESRALRLAHDALDRGLDRHLAPCEALFFFLTLARSERVDDVRRALDGVGGLETRCPQSQQRAAKSWRVDVLKRLDVLERFGRDPHRNAALGRETTAAEASFLARPEWADLFARARLPLADETPAVAPSAAPTPIHHRRVKILVLHGLRQNGAVFRARAKKMRRALDDLAELSFATSPLRYALRGATREAAIEALGEVPDFPMQQAWWHPSDDNRRYDGFDDSLAYLEGVFREQGPFDGVIGFSQGGTLAAVLAAMQPHPAIVFKFVVCISAFPSRAGAHAALVRPGSVAMPSLHIYGERDALVTPDRSRALFDVFAPGTASIVAHGGGHFVPGAWPVAELRAFVDRFVDHTELPADPEVAAADDAADPLSALVAASLRAPSIDVEALRSALAEMAAQQRWAELRRVALDAHALRVDGVDESALVAVHEEVVALFAEQLNRDLHALATRSDGRARQVAALLGGAHPLAGAEPWPSSCARHAPRVGSGADKICRLGRDIARELFPLEDMASRIAALGPNRAPRAVVAGGHVRRRAPQPLDATTQARNLSYQNFGYALSHLRNALAEMEPGHASAQLQRFQRARQFSPALIESLLDRPVSAHVSEPEPEPVVPCSLADLDPLLTHLRADAPVSVQTAFNKGTLTTDGRLDLCKQVVGPRGVAPLLEAMKMSQRVRRLLLGNNIVGDGGASAIADYIRGGAQAPLECWYIAGNRIGPGGVAEVCDALADDTHVTSLWLKRNPLKAAGMAPLAALLRANRTLEVLDVVNCGLLDEGLAVLLGGLRGDGANKTLKHLYLGTNGVSARSAPLLADYIATDCALESLYLSCNRLGDEGVEVIARALAANRSLRRFSLASNRVGPKGAAALSRALAEHPTLALLDLGFTKATVAVGELGNYVGDEGARSLAEMLVTNASLRVLDLLHNYIGQPGVNHLRAALSVNRTLVSMQLTQFGRVHNEPGREEVRAALARNLALVPEAEREAVTKVELPDHIGDIYSVYRTHS